MNSPHHFQEGIQSSHKGQVDVPGAFAKLLYVRERERRAEEKRGEKDREILPRTLGIALAVAQGFYFSFLIFPKDEEHSTPSRGRGT